MSAPHAYCPQHGLVSASSAIMVGDNVTGLTIENVTTQCPVCDQPVRMLDGTFNFQGGVMEIVQAPRWTWDVIGKVLAASRSAQEELQANPERKDEIIEQFAQDLQAADPSMWDRLKSLPLEVRIGLLIALISIFPAALSAALDVVTFFKDDADMGKMVSEEVSRQLAQREALMDSKADEVPAEDPAAGASTSTSPHPDASPATQRTPGSESPLHHKPPAGPTNPR
jgi:hypothetical protein